MANPSVLRSHWARLGSHCHQALRPPGPLATTRQLTSWKSSTGSLKTPRDEDEEKEEEEEEEEAAAWKSSRAAGAEEAMFQK